MKTYRCIFFSKDGKVVSRKDFEAESDTAAMVVAFMVADACSDKISAYSLWDGEGCVVRRTGPRLPSVFEIRHETQDRAARMEEAIRDSKGYLAESAKLLERIRQLRGPSIRHAT